MYQQYYIMQMAFTLRVPHKKNINFNNIYRRKQKYQTIALLIF